MWEGIVSIAGKRVVALAGTGRWPTGSENRGWLVVCLPNLTEMEGEMKTTETKATHTPGPWAIGQGHYIIGYPDSQIAVAHVLGNVGQPIEANANLIAAAPELLEAAKGILSLQDNDNLYEEWRAEFDALEDAIAKAKS